jgi:hypothetical protein
MVCVFCNCSVNLNTEMTIKLDDGTKIEVQICDEHAEEATLKTVKIAYQNRQDKIKEVLAQAAALGLNVTEGKGLFVAEQTKPSPRKTEALAKPVERMSPIANDDPDLVSTEFVDSRPNMQSVGGVINDSRVDSVSSHDMNNLTDKLPPEVRKGVAKLSVVEGRGGQPTAIPSFRKDGTGTTTIRIVKTTDNDLQESFRNMASDSMADKAPNFARGGYADSIRDCPFCSGSGTVKGSAPCPKCAGSGYISLH